jgi:hypothetical protein
MKHFAHVFVAVLVLTGAAATSQTSAASTKNKVTVSHASMVPVPVVCAK